MRLRNVSGAKEKIEASKYIVLEPKENKGKWKKVFGNDNPIHIEIGMGKGKFIFEHALRDRDINFIGIEKFDSVMVRAIEKLEDVELDNLKLIRTDALKIDEIFDKEIDTIYLNFSDPWPKNRHEDRRLSSEIFLKKRGSHNCLAGIRYSIRFGGFRLIARPFLSAFRFLIRLPKRNRSRSPHGPSQITI